MGLAFLRRCWCDPHSVDLRERMVWAVETGLSRRATARRFAVSVSSVIKPCSAGERAPSRLSALHGHEAHGRALSGFVDRLGVGHVVLLALDERRHVGWRDQPYLVAELADRPSP